MDIIERGYMLITLGVKGLMSLCVCLSMISNCG